MEAFGIVVVGLAVFLLLQNAQARQLKRPAKQTADGSHVLTHSVIDRVLGWMVLAMTLLFLGSIFWILAIGGAARAPVLAAFFGGIAVSLVAAAIYLIRHNRRWVELTDEAVTLHTGGDTITLAWDDVASLTTTDVTLELRLRSITGADIVIDKSFVGISTFLDYCRRHLPPHIYATTLRWHPDYSDAQLSNHRIERTRER